MLLFTKLGNKASNIQISLMKTNIGNGNDSTCQVVLMKKSITFNSHSALSFFPSGLIGPAGHKTTGLLIFTGPIIHPSMFYTCLSCLGWRGVKPLPACIGQQAG